MTKKERHLLWLLMDFNIYRYLISCSHGRWDGYEKSERHMNLCKIYLAYKNECNPDDIDSTSDGFESIHSATQGLTDNLDTMIGFPLDECPDYDSLAPLFFDKFIKLASLCMRE